MHVKVCYPDAVLNIRDIKAVIDAGDRIGEALENDLDELDANIDIKSAKESGISRREKILGINPLDTTGLEDRRLEVLTRWYDTPVYTETTLRNKLDSIMGKEKYILNINLEEKIVRYETEPIERLALNTVHTLLDQMVPLDYMIAIRFKYKQKNIFYIGNTVKETKTVKPAGITVKNPLDNIYWYANEKMDTLIDENGNVLEI